MGTGTKVMTMGSHVTFLDIMKCMILPARTR